MKLTLIKQIKHKSQSYKSIMKQPVKLINRIKGLKDSIKSSKGVWLAAKLFIFVVPH